LGRAQKKCEKGEGKAGKETLARKTHHFENPFVHERSFLIGAAW